MGKLADPFKKQELAKLTAAQRKSLQAAVQKHIKNSKEIQKILRNKFMPHYKKHAAAAAKSR